MMAGLRTVATQIERGGQGQWRRARARSSGISLSTYSGCNKAECHTSYQGRGRFTYYSSMAVRKVTQDQVGPTGDCPSRHEQMGRRGRVGGQQGILRPAHYQQSIGILWPAPWSPTRQSEAHGAVAGDRGQHDDYSTAAPSRGAESDRTGDPVSANTEGWQTPWKYLVEPSLSRKEQDGGPGTELCNGRAEVSTVRTAK